MKFIIRFLAGILLLFPGPVSADTGMQTVGKFLIDKTEVTIGQFRKFVDATGLVTRAEQSGGGLVYAAGWQRMRGWNWKSPFGKPARDDEPVVHVTWDEASAFCRWSGKRLPSDNEWVEAAYTERRKNPPKPFLTGKVYRYPTGDSPQGANCLEDCGRLDVPDRSTLLKRGRGHVKVATTARGVNGLWDMGANVWEWTDSGPGRTKRTRGGSWWYGEDQMRSDHVASKPRDMAAVYIGFRCAKDVK